MSAAKKDAVHFGCVNSSGILCGQFWHVQKRQKLSKAATCFQDSRSLYYLIREIKTWLNINHITAVHSSTYFIFVS